MGGGVTYQGVILPNRFGKSALNLEIEGYQEERAQENFGKIPGAGFLSRGQRWALTPHLTPPGGQVSGSHAAKESGRVGHPILVPGGLLVSPFWLFVPLVK